MEGRSADKAAATKHDPLLELLEPESRSGLARLAGSTPPTLTVLWGPQADLVEAAARTLGHFWVPPRYREVDLAVLGPDGRWDMAQLREQVLGACRVLPLQRRVVVVIGVSDLDRAGYDLLLKTVEEPPEGTVFVFTTPSMSTLPRTIVGRCGHDVAIRSVGGETRRRVLVTQGWRETDAARAVALGVPASWLPVVRTSAHLLGHFMTIRQLLDSTGTPARRAAGVVSALEDLTQAAAEGFGTGERGQRAARRSAVEWVMGQLDERVRVELAAGGDPLDGQRVLDAQVSARDQLAGNASLPLVLAVLLGAQDRPGVRVPARATDS